MAGKISNNRPFIMAFLVAGTLVVCAPARGEDFTTELRDLSIEELLNVDVVYGASKFEQKTSAAPASVTIIHADEIRQMGYRTLGEALDGVRGFYVTWDRNYEYLGARGFSRPGDYNSRVLFLVDGMRVTEDVAGSVEIGRAFPVDLSMVERIEIIRGPGSVLYGTSALFGVINVVTAHGLPATTREVSASAASYDTYEGAARLSGQVADSVAVTVSGSLHHSDGQDLYYREFDTPATHRGRAVGADGGHAEHGYASVSAGRFRLLAAGGSREKHVPTASFGSLFGDPNTRTVDSSKLLAATYQSRLPAGIGVNARLAYLDYVYKGWYTYADDEAPSGTGLSRENYLGRSITGEVQFSRALLDRHRLIGGVEYRRVPHQDQFVSWNDEPQLALDLSSDTWGAYLEEEFRPGRGFILSAGARLDHYSDFGGAFNPRLAAIWNPSPETVLKVLYGNAFRAPNTEELYYQDGGMTQKASKHLEPERIQTLEVVAHRHLGKRERLSLSVFNYRLKDLITLTTDPQDGLLVYQNLERVRSSGVELELRRTWTSGITGHVSYSYQETRDDLTDAILSNAPRQLVKSAIVLPVRIGLTAGVDVRYTGSRKTVRGGTADGYVTTNLTLLETALIPHLDLSLSIYNLFDARYGHPASEEHAQEVIPQDRRSARMTATCRF